MTTASHTPVLLRESLELLQPRSGGRYVDGTLGGGGHAEAILEASEPEGRLLGMDWDEEARARCTERLARFGRRLQIDRRSFSEMGDALAAIEWDGADGILIDLGVSSFHLDSAERGFSFARSGPLDMRMDRSRPRDAAAWLAEVTEDELIRILREYGEEPSARRIAKAILAAQRRGELPDTSALAAIVAGVVGRTVARHPATRTFQALRIAVNQELEVLERFLRDSYQWLRPGGRMVMISYHSLEDRLVKQAFRKWSLACLCPRSAPVCCCGWSRKVKPLTRRAMRPDPAEIARNPRSRSARLRAVERLAA